MRVGFLTRYSSLGASSRIRAMQYEPVLNAFGIETRFLPLLGDAYLSALYGGKRSLPEVARCYARRMRQAGRLTGFDLLWIEKELLPYAPLWIESKLLQEQPYVLDIDDAVFHNYDHSRSVLVRAVLGGKIDGLMAGARLVTAGNGYLAQRARASGARWVEVLPSVIDLDRYPAEAGVEKARHSDGIARLAWIGSPATAHYLELVRLPLQMLAADLSVELRVIGAAAPTWSGVRTRSIRWSESTEAEQLQSCDIGIMPLADGPWERGKCGYKLIQYMACSLPVVASAVGANNDIIASGREGFLVEGAEQWERQLRRLIIDPLYAAELGRQGRQKVVSLYSLQASGPRLADLLQDAINR